MTAKWHWSIADYTPDLKYPVMCRASPHQRAFLPGERMRGLRVVLEKIHAANARFLTDVPLAWTEAPTSELPSWSSAY